MANQRRRYKVGEHPEYDYTFDRLAQASAILDPGRAANDIGNFAILERMRTSHGLVRLLQEWQGTGDGFYIENRRPTPSHLKTIQLAIEKLHEDFETLNTRRINRGSRPLERVPSEMLEQLYKLEARQDVVRDEIKRLRHMKERISERFEEENNPCLPRGPIGNSKLRNGILVVIDGQVVAPDPEGVLRIKDSRSSYDGMLVADYKEYVVPRWRAKREAFDKAKRREERAAVREGRKPNFSEPYPKFPDWPKDVEKYNWPKVESME